jgi:hypothetical protein
MVLNATLFFVKKMTRAQSANWRSKKIVAYQIDKELFFEELLVKKNEQNGLFCIYIWY